MACSLTLLAAEAKPEQMTLEDTATLRLVHIYGYATMAGGQLPHLFGAETLVKYVLNRRDTITLEPEWIFTLSRAVTSITNICTWCI